ncbi:hydrolase [Oryctes borbonicus]|uniref:Epoxide hydrolase n=1 Tax=Oryctes borbonicus TaxID=1629725 RepID=A0A0T6BDK1_9SCAR|nr:hydrolase [Oryctes borbonicus]
MGLLRKIFFAIITVSIVLLAIKINNLFLQESPLPVLENVWWGPGRETKVDTSIRPFKINVPQKAIDDLQQRLRNARQFTPPLEGIQQQYGMNTELLSEIVEFWKTRYDWQQRQTWLNQYPQFKTNIQGLDIHFLRVKPVKADGLKVLPLLLLHGWPGSFREFYDAIPFLTTPRKGQDFVFELVIPSLPGYGFSQAASKPGLGPAQIAVIFKNLMERLRFEKYYIQGGDWGALIVSIMSSLYPDRILGVHSNMCFLDSPLATLKMVLGSIYPPAVVDKKYEEKLYPLSSLFEFLLLEFGYMHLQGTKPDTVGVGLNDSPVGLAAYILEKFTTWTNVGYKTKSDGGLKEKFSYVDLLDNVMIYWVTNTIGTSMRLYAEAFSKATMDLGFSSISVKIPSACARFANEAAYQPDNFLSLKYKNLVHTSDIEDGGHFAAFELPEIFANDVWIAVEKMETFYKSAKSSK